jgi:hypothetical protein
MPSPANLVTLSPESISFWSEFFFFHGTSIRIIPGSQENGYKQRRAQTKCLQWCGTRWRQATLLPIIIISYQLAFFNGFLNTHSPSMIYIQDDTSTFCWTRTYRDTAQQSHSNYKKYIENLPYVWKLVSFFWSTDTQNKLFCGKLAYTHGNQIHM